MFAFQNDKNNKSLWSPKWRLIFNELGVIPTQQGWNKNICAFGMRTLVR